MTRSVLLTIVFLLLVLSSSGCTDFVEPNQLAFVIGTGVDHVEDGTMEVSQQIVIPSQLSGQAESSGNSNSFVVMSAKGRGIFEASQKIQKKMSRRVMTSHRILNAISEEFLIKNDGRKLFDKLNRDPANNLRDITVLIKGRSAKDYLMLKHPIERLSSISSGKELQINGLRRFSTRQFILDSLSEGIRPLLPVLEIKDFKENDKKTDPIAVLSGFAALNKKLKVKGILDVDESSAVIWMAGKGSFHAITIPWKNGKGILAFRLTHLQRRIRSVHGNDLKRIILTVKAQAYLIENTTSLDMSEVDNMIEVQKYVNEEIQKEFQITMNKVQQWETDVIGIGEHLHRKYPYWWKAQKDDWDDNFKKVQVTVKSNIRLKSVGTSGGQIK
ncbi:Ger(x)C family spore germination protein [Cohnella lupini]|uniref:Ger(X)C family germination protein n=1 Tax=Cohnella lupini TaxID=1294267 RepID=A0A3D9ICB8_9BACL|nr:Ger(x)C family spore germination protein [Cohnella lupini]RED59317.1 Ger(x)C family germination protein [Cohnella lupini]